MLIEPTQSSEPSEPSEQPKRRSLLILVLKQIALAVLIGGIVLALYLAINNEETVDKTVGKYAYISRNGEYVGVIKGHGRSLKGSTEVYFIKQPTGELIEMSMSYVEVRDKPPNSDLP